MPDRSGPTYAINDNVITLFCSDGDPAFRPTPEELKPVINADRTVDYLHECTGADPTLRLWKLKIGTFLARWVLRLPGNRRYYLSSLPKGYSLFVHRKGDKCNPRTDSYLRGSATVTVFRSPAEFFFHAKWILLGCPKRDPRATPALDEELFGPPLPEEYTDRCGCTYCGGVSQTYISTHFSNYHPKKQVQGEAHKFHGKFEGIRKELYKKT